MHKYIKNRHKTSRLSSEENTELLQKYYDDQNVEQLIKEYNINTSTSGLSSTFQLIKTPEKICTYCKSEMYYVPPSKSAQHKKKYICKSCFHTEGKYSCECLNCLTHQLFNFIYNAIRNTAVKNNCSMQSANLLNEIYAALSSRYDKAMTENWSIKNYNRAYNQNVSELFKLLSIDLLGIREKLFYEPLNI